MKHLLFVVLVLSTFIADGQEKDLNYYLTEYKYPVKHGAAFFDIVDSSMQGKSKQQIYQAIQATVADLFKNSKNVVRIDDVQEAHLMGKGVSKINYKYMTTSLQALMHFTFDIRAKDGKYRIQLSDISFQEEYRGEYDMAQAAEKKGIGPKVLLEARKECDQIIEMIQSGIAKNIKNSSDF
jgi:hypothetical protein